MRSTEKSNATRKTAYIPGRQVALGPHGIAFHCFISRDKLFTLMQLTHVFKSGRPAISMVSLGLRPANESSLYGVMANDVYMLNTEGKLGALSKTRYCKIVYFRHTSLLIKRYTSFLLFKTVKIKFY